MQNATPASPRPALFLDRDGVLIEEKDYLSDPAQVVLIPGAAEAVARTNRSGVPVVVVTNQAGVARGYYPEEQVHKVHARIDELLAGHGAHIDRYYYCPHHPTEGVGRYRLDCENRKPRPGMLRRAARELGLDLARSYLVGDKISDVQAGINAGLRGTVLVRTGYGGPLRPEEDPAQHGIEFVAGNLAHAVDYCLPRLTAKGDP